MLLCGHVSWYNNPGSGVTAHRRSAAAAAAAAAEASGQQADVGLIFP